MPWVLGIGLALGVGAVVVELTLQAIGLKRTRAL
jgi:hypothetical protein